MVMLRRYWIKFDIKIGDPYSEWTLLGVGVTAFDIADALNMIQELLFGEDPLPPITSVVEDADISTLDKGHVLPNMGVPVWRGVWFPNLGAPIV